MSLAPFTTDLKLPRSFSQPAACVSHRWALLRNCSAWKHTPYVKSFCMRLTTRVAEYSIYETNAHKHYHNVIITSGKLCVRVNLRIMAEGNWYWSRRFHLFTVDEEHHNSVLENLSNSFSRFKTTSLSGSTRTIKYAHK